MGEGWRVVEVAVRSSVIGVDGTWSPSGGILARMLLARRRLALAAQRPSTATHSLARRDGAADSKAPAGAAKPLIRVTPRRASSFAPSCRNALGRARVRARFPAFSDHRRVECGAIPRLALPGHAASHTGLVRRCDSPKGRAGLGDGERRSFVKEAVAVRADDREIVLGVETGWCSI